MRLALPLLAVLAVPASLPAQACPAVPTALVLSGGGAKGLAHVGVIRALDSLRIRPDLVVGSSMGAIVGGLYASGYSGDQIDSLAGTLPLVDLFRAYEPRVPRSLGLLQPAIVWEDQGHGLVFQRAAVQDGEVNALLNAGFLRGNLAARGNFDFLPIPFRAVATDLLSGEAVVLATGDLAQAIRASAAIPLLFEPELLAGRYLGDGGLSANVPVGVARSQGAGRIIVSRTTEAVPDSLDLRSTFVLIDHLIGNLFRQPFDSLGASDVSIAPDVGGFQSLDFSPGAIRSLVNRGFDAGISALRDIECLPRGDVQVPALHAPVITSFSVPGGFPGDSAILARLFDIQGGTRLDIAAFRANLLRLGSSDRYSSVWLRPAGPRDSVSFHLLPHLASPRIVALGAAYDNDLGGRVWIGQVSRRPAGHNLELAVAGFFGELNQSLFSGLRFTSATSPAWVPVTEARATRELVRQFDRGTELAAVKVHEGLLFAGIELRRPRGWYGALGVEASAWDTPGRPGQGTIGPRLSLAKAGRMAEPLFSLQAEGNADFRRIEMEGIATLRLGKLQVRPRARYGAGSSLPLRRQFIFGGQEGFAGLHIGEIRSQRELSGSVVFLYPVWGPLNFRVEPMAGAVGGEGFLPDGEVITGVRAGVNLATGLGPVRLEYGVSDGGRDGLLVRLGRWF